MAGKITEYTETTSLADGDFFSPCEGNTTVENYGSQGGTGTITGTVTKFAGNPPLEPMENFL